MIIWQKTIIQAVTTTPINTALMIFSALGLVVLKMYQSPQKQPETQTETPEPEQTSQPEQPTQEPPEIDNSVIQTIIKKIQAGEIIPELEPVKQNGHIIILQQQYTVSITKPQQTKKDPQKPPKTAKKTTKETPDKTQQTVEQKMKNLIRGEKTE